MREAENNGPENDTLAADLDKSDVILVPEQNVKR